MMSDNPRLQVRGAQTRWCLPRASTRRYCDWLRRDWHGLSEDEKIAICDHLLNNDLPETRSILESQARAAGLDDAVERRIKHGLFLHGEGDAGQAKRISA